MTTVPPLLYTERLSEEHSFKMRYVAGGSFYMGSEEEEAFDDEQPIQEVEVSGFYMGKYPVTQALWKAVMGAENNPSFFRGDRRPVEGVSWEEVQEFLSALCARTGKAYRLPSEAEWEYAARGGRSSRGFKYAGSNKLKEVGWYRENSHKETKAVGLKLPNELGLYDMSGNVYEWCEDDWHDSYEGAPADGRAWIDGPERAAHRVVRGGCWYNHPQICRVSFRLHLVPVDRDYYLGFRLVLPLQSAG